MSKLTAVIIFVSVLLLMGIVGFQAYTMDKLVRSNCTYVNDLVREVTPTPETTPEVIIDEVTPATNSSIVQ